MRQKNTLSLQLLALAGVGGDIVRCCHLGVYTPRDINPSSVFNAYSEHIQVLADQFL